MVRTMLYKGALVRVSQVDRSLRTIQFIVYVAASIPHLAKDWCRNPRDDPNGYVQTFHIYERLDMGSSRPVSYTHLTLPTTPYV